MDETIHKIISQISDRTGFCEEDILYVEEEKLDDCAVRIQTLVSAHIKYSLRPILKEINGTQVASHVALINKSEEVAAFSLSEILLSDKELSSLANGDGFKAYVNNLERMFYIERCANCNGCGSITTECAGCKENGKKLCKKCSGKGDVDCQVCRGKGLVTGCQYCNYKGYVECPGCLGGRKEYRKCASCEGLKKRVALCSYCNGSGYYCDVCKTTITSHYSVYLFPAYTRSDCPDCYVIPFCRHCAGKGYTSIEDCITCGATGVALTGRDCRECRGIGAIACPEHSNDAKTACPSCTNGKVKCDECGGMGFYDYQHCNKPWPKVKCPACSGNGFKGEMSVFEGLYEFKLISVQPQSNVPPKGLEEFLNNKTVEDILCELSPGCIKLSGIEKCCDQFIADWVAKLNASVIKFKLYDEDIYVTVFGRSKTPTGLSVVVAALNSSQRLGLRREINSLMMPTVGQVETNDVQLVRLRNEFERRISNCKDECSKKINTLMEQVVDQGKVENIQFENNQLQCQLDEYKYQLAKKEEECSRLLASSKINNSTNEANSSKADQGQVEAIQLQCQLDEHKLRLAKKEEEYSRLLASVVLHSVWNLSGCWRE